MRTLTSTALTALREDPGAREEDCSRARIQNDGQRSEPKGVQ